MPFCVEMGSITPSPSNVSSDTAVNNEAKSSTMSTSNKVVLDENDGCFREVNAFQPWFANKQLAAFTKRYPLTGTKSNDIHHTRLPQSTKQKGLPYTRSEIRPAEYQLKLERLLLEKKERKLDTANARRTVLFQNPGMADEIDIRKEMQKLITAWAAQRRERNEEYDLRQTQARLEREMQEKREQLNTLRARKELEEEQKFRAEGARRQHVEDMASLKEDIARKEANIRELEKAIAQCALESHVVRTNNGPTVPAALREMKFTANNDPRSDRTQESMNQNTRHVAIPPRSDENSLAKDESCGPTDGNEKAFDNTPRKNSYLHRNPCRRQPSTTASLQSFFVGDALLMAPQPGAGERAQKKKIRKEKKE